MNVPLFCPSLLPLLRTADTSLIYYVATSLPANYFISYSYFMVTLIESSVPFSIIRSNGASFYR